MTSENPANTTPKTPIDCYRCGYDLRTIPDDHPCPECGLLAARSRRETDELHNTRPKWLASISWGVNLILLSICLTVAWPFASDRIYQILNSNPNLARPTYPNVRLISVLLGFAAAAIILYIGVALLTRREGYEPADNADRARRIALRIATLAPMFAIALLYGLLVVINPSQTPDQYAAFWIAFCLLTAGLIPMILLGFLHLRAIAKRAKSAHLAEHCVIVGVGTSFTALFVPAAVLYMNYAPHDIVSRNSPLQMIVPLFITVFISLFALWSLYLLIRFAISFRRAARQIQTKWTRDDRALESQ